ncbi:Histone-fold [Penicillium angulare]|uniref:Histone-fold n=1 Tax=Penicillium angulare TaxID=116970 RepID=UPI002541EAE6|nr:Histone-fold [Penicillium angulare]KAJ5288551.1 Histone-fold [Penicillium angulare]
MSTPKPHGRRSLGTSGTGANNTPSAETTLTGIQRLPNHSRFPLTPSRLVSLASPHGQRSASRLTPRARGVAAPATPYGLRARQQRAANTPGRDRRRSGKVQRETTFDILKNLGRALAPVSRPIQSSPQEVQLHTEQPKDEIEELDNEPEIERPRLSLNIQESEDGSEEANSETPPRMSLAFDDDDITYRSVEYPRDLAIRDRDRLSMLLPAGRLSENFAGVQLESDSDVVDMSAIPDDDEGAEDTFVSGGEFDRGGETEDLGRFHLDFNFPSPTAAPIDDPMADTIVNVDGFELSADDVQQMAQSSPAQEFGDTNAMFGFAQPESRSQSPDFLGGGLRDEDLPIQSKEKKLSRYGIPVPKLPTGVIKKLATRFGRTKAGSKKKLNKTTMAAIEQASSWFFEQASNDLAGYSNHAQRKVIDENDVTMLMRRQRHVNSSTTVFSLAQKHLPKELQQDMRLAMPP